MTDSLEPAVYKVAELAQLLDMGRRQTYEAITRGEIPCRKIGSSLRCSKVVINRWLNGEEVSDGGPDMLLGSDGKAAPVITPR